MVEVDLQDIQNRGNIFNFDTQSYESAFLSNLTSLTNEEKLIEEIVQINEIAIMGSMLMSLMKFDRCCILEEFKAQDDQQRNQKLKELKLAENMLKNSLDQCKKLINNLNTYSAQFEQTTVAAGIGTKQLFTKTKT